MIDAGAIRPSQSPYSSNAVKVRKKDGTIRFCVDFRRLNSKTIKDAYLRMDKDTTARVLFEHFFVHFGFPGKLHNDQCANFESKVIQQLCKFTGTAKIRTIPYHPMGNGMCERFNKPFPTLPSPPLPSQHPLPYATYLLPTFPLLYPRIPSTPLISPALIPYPTVPSTLLPYPLLPSPLFSHLPLSPPLAYPTLPSPPVYPALPED